jgi:hypothetical protein
MSGKTGKFKKGCSGNPRGRPLERLTIPSVEEHRKGLLRRLYRKRTMRTKDGKKKRLCPKDIIYDNLIALGISGDRQSIIKILTLEDDIIAASTRDKMKLMSEILRMERRLRENPDLVSERLLDDLKLARRALEEGDNLD